MKRVAKMTAAEYKGEAGEKAFMQTILDAARALNWRCYHTYDSRRSERGFPDLCCVRGEVMIAWEVKTDTGKLSLHQREWLAILRGVPGVISGVVRPSDWDAIEATLKGER